MTAHISTREGFHDNIMDGQTWTRTRIARRFKPPFYRWNYLPVVGLGLRGWGSLGG